jgi:hypothetical protein
MSLDVLWAWRPALLALAVSLAWAALFRALRRPDLAAMGAGLGIAAGWVLAYGTVSASPRQLPERLPMLALATTAGALVLAPLLGSRRGAALTAAVLLLLGSAWWLVGGPLAPGDLRRATLPLVALALLLLGLALRLDGPRQAAAAAGFLALGLLGIGGPPGPWALLTVTALAALLGSLPAGAAWPVLARVPVAAALAALVAGPVLVRGSGADWLIAAAPVSALWLGPSLAAALGTWVAAHPLAWLAAGGLPLLLAWLLVRGP